MGNRDGKTPCARCGVGTSAEFCLDCQRVDPKMTAGGLSSREMGIIRAAATKQKRADSAMLYRVAGQGSRYRVA